MADPFTLAVAGLTGLTGFQGSKAEKEQGRAEQAAAMFNADIIEKRGLQEETLIRRRSKQQQGLARVAIAKSGITVSGSALDALAESAANAEIDALNARFDATTQARLQRMQGQVAQRVAKQRSGARLLSTVADVGSVLLNA